MKEELRNEFRKQQEITLDFGQLGKSKSYLLNEQQHNHIADWWLKKLDLAVSKERERIVKWVKDNEYCSKCCFPKKSCRKWGESASAIDTDDLLALINTK